MCLHRLTGNLASVMALDDAHTVAPGAAVGIQILGLSETL
jgi:hypothetical protein